MNAQPRTIFFLLITTALWMGTGCGGGGPVYEGPQRVPVTGTVKFDGQAVTSGSIMFVPQGTDQAPAGGIIADGNYSIREGIGPNLGKYQVKISWLEESGEEIDEEEVDEDGEPIWVPKELIPAKYNEESELTVEISAGPNTHDFDLKP